MNKLKFNYIIKVMRSSRAQEIKFVKIITLKIYAN